MTLTAKENSLIKELRSQEQICVEKYSKYANDACDSQLKNMFTQIGQVEQQHLQTLDQISSGTVPQMGGGNSPKVQVPTQASSCSQPDKQKDAFLCSDLLSTEKHVSSVYDTSIFEFCDPALRNVLNHIQKEEQEHGEHIYKYMSLNGMYG